MNRIPIGILGATGVVGQQYVQLLADHPWFEVSFLASSQRSSNQRYDAAIAGRWRSSTPLPEHIGRLEVHAIDDIAAAKRTCRLVFSAVGSDVAKEFESRYAHEGIAVVTNASFHRNDPDIPVLIPEVNPHHLEILPQQQRLRNWKGFIVAKPNCSIQSYLIPLWPLHQKFEISKVIVTTMQAISGAGYPGIPASEISDNIIPYISGEEEKSEWEPLKIMGTIEGDAIINASDAFFSAHCNRVPVTDGHMACVSVAFKRTPSPEQIAEYWQSFRGEPQLLGLPSAPTPPIILHSEFNRPQTRLDRNAGEGMAVSVGRLRPCPVLDFRFVGLSHNTLRGAAGGGILIAELLTKQQYII